MHWQGKTIEIAMDIHILKKKANPRPTQLDPHFGSRIAIVKFFLQGKKEIEMQFFPL